jgi:Concanavalin A-like lectin/glucanases superfamily
MKLSKNNSGYVHSFDGSSDYIELPDSPELRLTSFSIAAWFKTSKDYAANPKHEGIILMKGGWLNNKPGKQVNYGIWMSDRNHVRGGFEEPNGTDHFCTTTGTVFNDNIWHHGCVTYDLTAVKLYMDGKLYQFNGKQYGTHLTTAVPDTGSLSLRIGRNPYAPPSYDLWYKGNLDEVYLWKVGLTESEVRNLYTKNLVPQTNDLVDSLRH